MFEVLYDKGTLEVRALNRDPRAFGMFKPKENEAVVRMRGNPPKYDSDQFYVDLEHGTIKGEPLPEEEPLKFEPLPGSGLTKKVEHIEEFLREAFK